jgi:hypothetical protein
LAGGLVWAGIQIGKNSNLNPPAGGQIAKPNLKSQNLIPTLTPIITSSPLLSETPTKEGDETANWKTYSNRGLFQINYPAEGIVQERAPGVIDPTVAYIFFSNEDKTRENCKKILIAVYENYEINKNSTVETVATRELAKGEYKYTLKKIQIAGYRAVKADVQTDCVTIQYFIASPEKNLFVHFSTIREYGNILDQILPTFRFVD